LPAITPEGGRSAPGEEALDWPEIPRLMTVAGVNLICAATFIAAVGDPRARKLAILFWSTNLAIRHAERVLAAQAEASYKRLVTDQSRSPGQKSGRERDTGARMK
jgi:hypothetical protein